jgi:hypothetical protein
LVQQRTFPTLRQSLPASQRSLPRLHPHLAARNLHTQEDGENQRLLFSVATRTLRGLLAGGMDYYAKLEPQHYRKLDTMASYDNNERSGNDSRNRSRGGSVGSSRNNGYGGGGRCLLTSLRAHPTDGETVALSDGGSNYTPRNVSQSLPASPYHGCMVANHTCNQRRQTLRDSSYHDLPNWRNGPGPAAGSSFNRSNTSSTPVGGLVQSYSMGQAQAESYGTQVFDSPERGLRGRDQLMVQQPDVFIAGAPVSISPSAQAMLAAGK